MTQLQLGALSSMVGLWAGVSLLFRQIALKGHFLHQLTTTQDMAAKHYPISIAIIHWPPLRSALQMCLRGTGKIPDGVNEVLRYVVKCQCWVNRWTR